VPARRVQDEIREQFRRWGLPGTLRVDNGVPWGNWNDLPTVLALWLYGLGVRLHWNDPCHPEQNPQVERSQGTGSRWAEPEQSQSVSELQQRFDKEDRVQRELYPAIRGLQSRWEAFPGLRHSGRPYSRKGERASWDLGRAVAHLAEYQAVRKVSTSGHVRVYAANYYVGQSHAGQWVYVQLDPDTLVWVIADAEGRQLRTHPAWQITRQRIMALNLRDKS